MSKLLLITIPLLIVWVGAYILHLIPADSWVLFPSLITIIIAVMVSIVILLDKVFE